MCIRGASVPTDLISNPLREPVKVNVLSLPKRREVRRLPSAAALPTGVPHTRSLPVEPTV